MSGRELPALGREHAQRAVHVAPVLRQAIRGDIAGGQNGGQRPTRLVAKLGQAVAPFADVQLRVVLDLPLLRSPRRKLDFPVAEKGLMLFAQALLVRANRPVRLVIGARLPVTGCCDGDKEQAARPHLAVRQAHVIMCLRRQSGSAENRLSSKLDRGLDLGRDGFRRLPQAWPQARYWIGRGGDELRI